MLAKDANICKKDVLIKNLNDNNKLIIKVNITKVNKRFNAISKKEKRRKKFYFNIAKYFILKEHF